jgi:isoleucyl-tRNA synthetase
VHAEVTHHLDTHELDKATRPILPFIDDLSTWYIRRSRERFKSDDVLERTGAVKTTGWILLQLATLIAPFMPFLAEDLYRRLKIDGKKESVHLETWPSIGVAVSAILDEMVEVRRIVSLALEARAKAGIKVRQPLAMLKVAGDPTKWKNGELADIIKDEVNVHAVEIGAAVNVIELDTVITPELKEEGDLRDVIRLVQDMRKKHGLDPVDRIKLTVPKDKFALLEKYRTEFVKTVGAEHVQSGDDFLLERV